MEFIRELLPFFLAMVAIPPLLMLLIPTKWSGLRQFIGLLVLSIGTGLVGSTIVGEQFGELTERIIALVIDTSTAYAGSQIAYWLFWKPVLSPYLRRQVDPQE